MKRKLIEAALRWFAGGVFREIAEGKRGPTLQRWYIFAQGKKTKTGGVLAFLLLAVGALRPDLVHEVGPWLGTAATILVAGGLIDKQWRKQAPPKELAESFHTVMSFGPVVAAGFALLVELLPRIPNCASCADWVSTLQVLAAGIGTATGWIAAHLSDPPDLSNIPDLEA
jgi:hypothetical protein